MVSTAAGLVRGEEYTEKRRYTTNWTTRWQLEHAGACWSTLEHVGGLLQRSTGFIVQISSIPTVCVAAIHQWWPKCVAIAPLGSQHTHVKLSRIRCEA